MSVRLKISLMIAFAGFLSGVVFSTWMIRYVLHEYAEAIDHDLKIFSIYAVDKVISENGTIPEFDNNKYWLEIYREKVSEPVYRSGLAEKIRIKAVGRKGAWNETVNVDTETRFVRSSKDNTAIFRVKAKPFFIGGVQYTAYTALPVEYLKGEAIELLTGLAGGLVFSVIFYFGGSYFIAGLILRPVRSINQSTRNITEKQLHLRLPVRETGRENDEFNNLAKTLNGLFDRLENAFNRQKRLISDVSHELKTPLSIMRLASDNIAHKSDGDSVLDISAEAAQLSEQIIRMDRLIKSILNLSALDMMNSVNGAPVDISKILASLADDYRILAEARGIDIVCGLQPALKVSGDAEKLTRALSNILDNAVKYSHDGGVVHVISREEDKTAVVEVINGGDGVPEEAVGRVFDEFYRVEQSRSSDRGGAGLGLSIVRRTVELHGGTVYFESVSGGLTRIRLIFPSL